MFCIKSLSIVKKRLFNKEKEVLAVIGNKQVCAKIFTAALFDEVKLPGCVGNYHGVGGGGLSAHDF